MYLYIVYLLILILFFASIRKKNFSDSFLDIAMTKNFNGLFVIMVFLSHFSQYVELPKYIEVLQKIMGQLIVVPFLFVSGYGVTSGFLYKKEYKKTFLIKRVLYLYLQFVLVVSFYCLLDFILTKEFNLEKAMLYLMGFTGLKSVGNSNWYIVAILLCYLTSYLGFFKISKFSVWISFLLICLYAVLMFSFGFDFHWYNTVFAYFAGELVALYKNRINMFFKNIARGGGNIYIVFLEIILFGGLFIMYWFFKNNFIRTVLYNLVSVSFCILFVTFTFTFYIDNALFTFLGSYVFGIYIFQRFPMILFSGFIHNDFLFFMISIITTIFLAVIFDFCFKRVLKK